MRTTSYPINVTILSTDGSLASTIVLHADVFANSMLMVSLHPKGQDKMTEEEVEEFMAVAPFDAAGQCLEVGMSEEHRKYICIQQMHMMFICVVGVCAFVTFQLNRFFFASNHRSQM